LIESIFLQFEVKPISLFRKLSLNSLHLPSSEKIPKHRRAKFDIENNKDNWLVP
jgi:hypothetical protein